MIVDSEQLHVTTVKKSGHIAKVCRSTKVVVNETVNSVILNVNDNSSSNKPIQVAVMVNGQKVLLHLDTGSPTTLITEKTWNLQGGNGGFWILQILQIFGF